MLVLESEDFFNASWIAPVVKNTPRNDDVWVRHIWTKSIWWFGRSPWHHCEERSLWGSNPAFIKIM